MRKTLESTGAALAVVLLVLTSALTAASGASAAEAIPVAQGQPFQALPIAAPTRIGVPQRVVWLGDSLSASLNTDLESRLAARGIDFAYIGHPGTGPLTQQGSFWRDSLADAIASMDPDLVIVQASGNYNIGGADPFIKADGSVLEHGSDEFFSVWNAHVRDLIARAESAGAHTLLVTAPVVDPVATSHPVSNDHNRGYAHLARKTGAELLDWNRLLAPDGVFLPTIHVDGSDVPLRDGDGLHFADSGRPVVADWLVGKVCEPHVVTV